MKSRFSEVLIPLAVLGLVLLAAPTAQAFPSSGDCMGCHSGFRSGSPSLHDYHTQHMNSCTDCHMSVGDTPKTNKSGNYGNYACNGCHLLEGLATKHGAANCGCHSGVIGASAGEQVLPYYYQGGRSTLVNTCRLDPNNGGEDFDGDGFGLDNDGDGAYDAGDPDCNGIVEVLAESWSTLKSLFETQR